MKFSLDCYPCAVRHALTAIRKTGVDESTQTNIMKKVLQGLLEMDQDNGSNGPTVDIQTIIREETGLEDIYENEKAESTREALALYPELKEKVTRSSDPLETAVRLSIAGNIIDYGALQSYDLIKTIERVERQPLALNDMEDLRSAIDQAEQILYLADNAGETVFDRLLIETIGKPVVYAVKDAPVLNDATLEDAYEAGLESVAEVVSCGARTAGTVLNLCSPEFLERFHKAELIIAKGMGNYEVLSTEAAPIFFLLQVKCELVARDTGVPKGSIVVAKTKNYPKS